MIERDVMQDSGFGFCAPSVECAITPAIVCAWDLGVGLESINQNERERQQQPALLAVWSDKRVHTAL